MTTHPVLADGRPDMSRTLATQDLRPCSEPTSVVDVRQGIVRLKMGIDATRGREYATVIRNTDADPDHNFTSPNFLYTETGILGANGRNERSLGRCDLHFFLQQPAQAPIALHLPLKFVVRGVGRFEIVHRRQHKVGGARERRRLPPQERFLGVPPCSRSPGPRNADMKPTRLALGVLVLLVCGCPSDADNANRVRYNLKSLDKALGAYTAKGGSGTLTLTVNGSVRARARVAGPRMVRATIKSVTVQPGQTVKVTSSGLSIQNVVADDAWGYLMGMNLPSAPWHLDGDPEFSHAAPVYALPAYGSDATAAVASAGHRTTPAIQPSRPKHHRKHHKHHASSNTTSGTTSSTTTSPG